MAAYMLKGSLGEAMPPSVAGWMLYAHRLRIAPAPPLHPPRHATPSPSDAIPSLVSIDAVCSLSLCELIPPLRPATGDPF